MRVLVAPATYKECLSSVRAAGAMAEGVRRARAEPVLLPLSDGGQGTTECLVRAARGRLQAVGVTGPLGRPVTASLGLLTNGRSAVLEMAAASGLALVAPGERDPMHATTRGTGELIRAALNADAREILLGIGDSATCDGGAGMAQALGVRLLDKRGGPVGPGAAGLRDLAHIDVSRRDPRLADATLRIACDVDNPLTGPHGAARVFGPQKGATPDQVRQLEEALRQLADVIRRDLRLDVFDLPGGGAAGGLGAGAVAFLGASLQSGAETVLDILGVDDLLTRADLVLTGEGRLDAQSLAGKAPVALARRAKAVGVPCAAIPGSLGPGHEAARDEGLTAIFPLVTNRVTLADALARAETLLADRAEEAVRRAAGRH